MKLPPYRVADHWSANRDSSDVLVALAAVVVERGWRVQRIDEFSMEASFGSRLALRIFSATMRPGRSRLPMVMKLSVTPCLGSGTNVDAVIESDEGWYLFRIRETEIAFEKAFSDTLAIVKKATT